MQLPVAGHWQGMGILLEATGCSKPDTGAGDMGAGPDLAHGLELLACNAASLSYNKKLDGIAEFKSLLPLGIALCTQFIPRGGLTSPMININFENRRPCAGQPLERSE